MLLRCLGVAVLGLTLARAVGVPFRASQGIWTPAKTSPALWLAPDQATSITLNGANVADQLNLGSVGNSYADEGAGFQPDYDTTTFSAPSVRYVGTDPNALVYTGAAADWTLWRGTSSFEQYWKVALAQVLVATRRFVATRSPGGTDSGFDFGDPGGTGGGLKTGRLARGGGNWITGAGGGRDTTPHLVRVRFDSGSAGNRRLRIWYDGIIMTDVTGGTNPLPTTPIDPMTLGAFRSGAATYIQPWDGWIGRGLGYFRVLTDGERQSVERYIDGSLGGPRLPLIDQPFDVDSGFSTASIGTAGSYAITGGECVITNVAGAARDLLVRQDSPLLVGANTGPLIIARVTSETLNNGYNVPGVGLCQDGNNLVLCEYSKNPATATYTLRLLVRIGGASTFLINLAETSHPPPYTIALGLNNDGGGAIGARIYSDFDGAGLRYRGHADVTALFGTLGALDTAISTWPTCVSFASAGVTTATMGFDYMQAYV